VEADNSLLWQLQELPLEVFQAVMPSQRAMVDPYEGKEWAASFGFWRNAITAGLEMTDPGDI
jgi:hypothetical protein